MSNQLLTLMCTQAWQIAVLAIVVAIVTRTVAKNRPHLAHAMWLLVLIKCVTPPIWGHPLGLFSRLQAAISTEQIPAASDAPSENMPQAAEPASSLVRSSLELELHVTGNMASDKATTPGLPTTESPAVTVPAVDMSEVTATESVEGLRGLSYSWPAILLSCVTAGAFVTLSLMIVRCVQCLRSIHRHRTTEFDAMLIERVQDLSHKLRLRRAPRVIVSDVLFGPAVLGLLRHTIVLPRCLLSDGRSFLPERTFAEGEPARSESKNAGLPVDTACTQVAASREVLPGRQDLPKPLPGRQELQFLDPILAHELLHIRRGDLRTGLLQAIVQSLWWFHPAVWLCNRWLSREAERCCDEQVIAELGCSPAQYARSLLSVIESKHQLQPVPVFPGMKPVEITTQRMERIMSLKSNLKKQTPLWCWLAVAALAIIVLPGAVAKTTRHDEPSVLAPLFVEPRSHESHGDSKVRSKHKGQVRLRAFKGNTFSSDRDLREHLLSKRNVWNFIGEAFEPGTIQADTEALKDYYRNVGFFDVEVTGEPLFSLDRSSVCLDYTLTEGRQYRLRDILCEGNKRIASSDLLGEIALKPGDHYNAAEVAEGVRRMRDRYIRADDNPPQINPVPRLNEEMGILDLVFEIEETNESPTSSPASEPLMRPVNDEPGVTNVSIRPVPTAIAASADLLLQLVWEAREQVRRRLLPTTDHTPWQIMSGIEGLRRDMLLKDDKTTVNALQWIQAGPQYQGESWFEKTEHGGRAHPFSKPYWFEGHVNQFLSKFAACRLPLDTHFGTPDGPITIQDMINHAKMVVNDKEEVSWTLLALCRYLPPDTKWTNAKGEEWSIERLVDIEVGKTVGGPTSPNGGTDGLYALAIARNEYLKTGKPLEGVWLKADEKIRKYIEVAKSQQNPDGTLSSDFFRSSKRKDDFDKRLVSSGHLLQFLMHAVSDEQLNEEWIRRAVEATASDIQVNRKEYVSCGPLFTATEALTTYLERVTKTSIGCAPRSSKSEETSVESLNSSTEPSTDVPVVSAEPSRDDRLILITYNVADLIAQFKTTDAEMDFSPLVELIRTSIEPESWETGRGAIFANKKTVFLVIRQTQTGHDGIAKIIWQLRKSYDSVKVTCRLIKLTADSQLKGLEDKCSLHSLSDDQRWALLTKSRSESLQKFLADEKAEVLSCPTIMTISGQPALVQVATKDGAALTGFQLSANPHLIADSSVIRLSHSVTVGELAKDAQAAVHESLVGSGQTLLLVIEQPGKVDGQPDRFVVMLTPEHVKEEEETLPR